MKKIKVAVIGAGGRMGINILELLSLDKTVEIVGASEEKNHPISGKILSSVISGSNLKIKIENNLDKALSKADGIIDFSTPESSLATARYASENNKSLVYCALAVASNH